MYAMRSSSAFLRQRTSSGSELSSSRVNGPDLGNARGMKGGDGRERSWRVLFRGVRGSLRRGFRRGTSLRLKVGSVVRLYKHDS